MKIPHTPSVREAWISVEDFPRKSTVLHEHDAHAKPPGTGCIRFSSMGHGRAMCSGEGEDSLCIKKERSNRKTVAAL